MLRNFWNQIVNPSMPADASARASVALDDEPDVAAPTSVNLVAEPISGFACFILYRSANGAETFRSITCHRIEMADGSFVIRALCHKRERPRAFRVDRIIEVADFQTGEVLGDGQYFSRFVDGGEVTSSANDWGLSRSQKSALISGLNALAFMAKVDGRWHPLEGDVIEAYVRSTWLRKEWPNDPPLEAIVAHARRLAPDAETFFASLKTLSKSEGSRRLIVQSLHALASADGVITDEEFQALCDMEDYLDELDEDRRYSALYDPTTIAIISTRSTS